jgi:hypothetical protein
LSLWASLHCENIRLSGSAVVFGAGLFSVTENLPTMGYRVSEGTDSLTGGLDRKRNRAIKKEKTRIRAGTASSFWIASAQSRALSTTETMMVTGRRRTRAARRTKQLMTAPEFPRTARLPRTFNIYYLINTHITRGSISPTPFQRSPLSLFNLKPPRGVLLAAMSLTLFH